MIEELEGAKSESWACSHCDLMSWFPSAKQRTDARAGQAWDFSSGIEAVAFCTPRAPAKHRQRNTSSVIHVNGQKGADGLEQKECAVLRFKRLPILRSILPISDLLTGVGEPEERCS